MNKYVDNYIQFDTGYIYKNTSVIYIIHTC